MTEGAVMAVSALSGAVATIIAGLVWQVDPVLSRRWSLPVAAVAFTVAGLAIVVLVVLALVVAVAS